LKFFAGEGELEKELHLFIASRKPRVGLVSLEAPLISNLSVWANIALIRQYHEQMPRLEARINAVTLLRRLGMASIAEKRNPSLSSVERFSVMLLRAATVREGVLVLDRPFTILAGHPDDRFIRETLLKLDDLVAEVYIFDYSWEKGRYGSGLNAEG
jgi:ABC-type nitrate/sulfonate/bicarbonate transport system ATPase subunit